MDNLISLSKFEETINQILNVEKTISNNIEKYLKEEVFYLPEYNKMNFEDIKTSIEKVKKLFDRR